MRNRASGTAARRIAHLAGRAPNRASGMKPGRFPADAAPNRASGMILAVACRAPPGIRPGQRLPLASGGEENRARCAIWRTAMPEKPRFHARCAIGRADPGQAVVSNNYEIERKGKDLGMDYCDNCKGSGVCSECPGTGSARGRFRLCHSRSPPRNLPEIDKKNQACKNNQGNKNRKGEREAT